MTLALPMTFVLFPTSESAISAHESSHGLRLLLVRRGARFEELRFQVAIVTGPILHAGAAGRQYCVELIGLGAPEQP